MAIQKHFCMRSPLNRPASGVVVVQVFLLLDFRVFVQTLDAVTKPERGLVLVSLRQGTVVREDRGSNSGHDDPLAVF